MSACSPATPESRTLDYIERLARPLDLAAPEYTAPPSSTISPPRWQALQIDIPADNVDGLDFLRLRGCALQTTVARRNSSLGKVAPPSQRLLLDLAFLREAPACIEKLRNEDEQELAAQLNESLVSKQQNLGSRIFNATLGGPEFRQFWQAGRQSEAYPADTSSLVLTAAEQLAADVARWLDGDYRADSEKFELALSEIAKGDGGTLLVALTRQGALLAAADLLVDKQLAKGSLCEGGRIDEAAPILRTVVQKFFIGQVQPQLAALNQRYHALMPPLQTLEETLRRSRRESLPAAFEEWTERRDGALADALAAPAAHVAQLQLLLGACYAEFAQN
ncbi:MAG: hypothetical protein Cons2KO_31410 [Congregibacter sp.]